MAPRVHILTLLFLPYGLRSVAATCFYPNGDSDSGHRQCSSSGGASVCCAEGFQCLSNGLCADPRYDDFQRVLRGGCTDKGWGAGCPGFCTDDWTDRDRAVHYCGNGKWCCKSNECCDEQDGIMDLGTPNVVATATLNGGQVEQTPAPSPKPTSAPTPQPSDNPPNDQPNDDPENPPNNAPPDTDPTSTPSKPPTNNSNTPSNKEQSTPSNSLPKSPPTVPPNTLSAAPSNTPLDTLSNSPSNVPSDTRLDSKPAETVIVIHNNTSSNPDQKPSTNNTLAIGVGIGVGVGVLLFAGLFSTWCFLKRRRKHTRGITLVDRPDVYERRAQVGELEGDTPFVGELAGDGEAMEMEGKAGWMGVERDKDKEREHRAVGELP